MPDDLDELPGMRMGGCPFCEQEVLVYEDPPRCPLCGCPIDGTRMRPYVWPDGEPSPSG